MLCLLAGCFFLRAEAKRADLNRAAELLETEKTTSTNGQYCNVKETASDLQPSYANPPIQFSFKNAEGGCSPLQTLFLHLGDYAEAVERGSKRNK